MSRPRDRGGRAGRLSGGELAWTLTEAANEPFFNLVIRYVFAPYFAATLAAGAASGTSLWAYAVGASGLVIALTAPFVGAVADSGARLKPWLAAAGAVTALAAGLLWFGVPGTPLLLVAFLVFVAGVSAEFINMFANSLLAVAGSRERLGFLSGLAFGFSQAAGLLVLLVILWLSGLETAIPHLPDRMAGPLAAAAVVVCLLPYLLVGPDRSGAPGQRPSVGRGLAQLRATLAEAWRLPPLRTFLLARMFAADGMAVVFAFGAVLAGLTFGWKARELALFGFLITIFGVAGGLGGALLDRRLGARRLTLLGLLLIMLGTVSVVLTDEARLFGIATGVALGAPLASPQEWGFLAAGAFIATGAAFAIAGMRTMMANLAPPERLASYFGLYSFVGKATAFIGPFLVGLVTDATGSLRPGIGVALAFLAIGLLLFRRVGSPKPLLAARG